MRSPDESIVTALAACVPGLSVGTTLFAGPVRAQVGAVSRSASVFVLATGGYPPSPYQDGTRAQWVISTVQITVRSAPDAFGAGQELARRVRDALDRNILSGSVDVSVREAEPSYLGQDPDGAHRWSMNIEVSHQR